MPFYGCGINVKGPLTQTDSRYTKELSSFRGAIGVCLGSNRKQESGQLRASCLYWFVDNGFVGNLQIGVFSRDNCFDCEA